MKYYSSGKIIVAIIAGALTLSLGACASSPSTIKVSHLSPVHYAPSSQLQMLNRAPSTNFVAIARLSISGAAGQTRAQLLALLLKKAGQLGANALQIIKEEPINISSTNGPASFNPAGGNYEFKPPIEAWRIHADALKIGN